MNIREHINLFENENDVVTIKPDDLNEILNATGFGILYFYFQEAIREHFNPDRYCGIYCEEVNSSFAYNPNDDTIIINFSTLEATEHMLRSQQGDYGFDYADNNEQDYGFHQVGYLHVDRPLNFIGNDSSWDDYLELQLTIKIISTLNKFKNYTGTNNIKKLLDGLDSLGGAEDFVKRYGRAGLKQFLRTNK